MFDFVQERKRLVQVVLLLIILPFAFFGVDSYNKATKGKTPASVNGTDVTLQDYDNAMRQQQARMRQMLGEAFDANLFETPEIKKVVLDSLIGQKLLVQRAKAAGLTVTDEQIAEIIGGIEAFQVDGKFDKKRYETVLSNKQMSPLMFEAQVREDILAQQMQEVFAQNGFAANSTVDNIIRLNEQKRMVSVAQLPFSLFLAQVKVDEAAIKQYYDKNTKEFELPEQVKVAYVKFAAGNLAAKIEVSPADAQAYYKEHGKEFGAPEQRQAAHILINVDPQTSAAEQDAAKAKAEQLLAKVKQAPASFADLAKQNSQDLGSAANGGDVGFFGQEQMMKPFAEATFALKIGEVSGLVKSDSGYHIIKLLAIKPAQIPAFDNVRDQIVAKLREQKANDKFAELADKFNNAAYEQSDTLKAAAELSGAQIEQSDWLKKSDAGNGIWNAKLLQAIFSDDVMKNKRNTAAIEVAPNTLVAARLLEHKPAAVRPLNEVRAMISEKLQHKQAVELAVQQGKAQLAALQKGGAATVTWGAPQAVSRAQRPEMELSLLRQVFQANTTKLPQVVGAETAQGYTLVRVESVQDGEKVEDGKRLRYAQQLRQRQGEELYRAYIDDAKKQAKIKLDLSVLPSSKP